MPTRRILADASQRALRAPSLLWDRPWRWRVNANALELRTDQTQLLTKCDIHDWRLMVACGATLHHARVALAAAGHRPAVTRFPDTDDPCYVARIRRPGWHDPDPHDLALDRAIEYRRSDSPTFGTRSVPVEALDHLSDAVAAEGVQSYIAEPGQMPMVSLDMPWGAGGYSGAACIILSGVDDTPLSWLRLGEAWSALLLSAVLEGLSTTPLSNSTDKPYLAVQVGFRAELDTKPTSWRQLVAA